MPALFTNLALGLLAMQVMAGPLADSKAHRRHHARHARRACRVRPSAIASAGLIGGGGNGGVPVYVSESGVSLVDSASATTSDANEYLTGTSIAFAVPTTSIDRNDPNPVSGFISASASSTETDKGIIDVSISLEIPGIGHSTTAPIASATSLSLSSAVSAESSVSDSSASSISLSSAISASLPATTTSASASASPSASSLPPITGTNDKRVFAHYMVGIVSQFVQSDWEKEMQTAKDHGIDGFALNIGTDDYTQKQLDNAFAAAEVVDFDLFISFDFNWYSTSDVNGVATMFKRYMDKPKQYKVDGKPFVSTFIGDGFDWGAVEQQVGKQIHAVPFYEPSASNADLASLSGLFSWAAWPGQQGNVPVKEAMTDARDLLYMSFTEPVGKDYMAPVSPWFYTHFGKEVPYSKNWLFYSETLWYDRWEQILKMQDNLKFLEIVTWNDYGESHYIGPYDTPHTDDGSSRYTKGLDHTAHLEFAVPYIKAFKTGSKTPVIDQDMLVYWYRPHLKSASCDATDNVGSKPTGWDMVADEVFVATMTKNGGSFTATSGGNGAVTHQAAAGVQIFRIPMGVGEQKFTFTASGQQGDGTSSIPISADCWNGVYNFNYHSGSIKL